MREKKTNERGKVGRDLREVSYRDNRRPPDMSTVRPMNAVTGLALMSTPIQTENVSTQS